MRRLDALAAIYDRLASAIVVTIMGALPAELQSIGHRPNFFYLQHAMGLASSMGLGLALSKPDRHVVVLDGDGSVLMNLGGVTTLARYRPRNLTHIVFDNESLLSVSTSRGDFPTATSTGSDLAGIRSRLECKNFGPANSGRDEQNGQQRQGFHDRAIESHDVCGGIGVAHAAIDRLIRCRISGCHVLLSPCKGLVVQSFCMPSIEGLPARSSTVV